MNVVSVAVRRSKKIIEISMHKPTIEIPGMVRIVIVLCFIPQETQQYSINTQCLVDIDLSLNISSLC